MPEDDWPNEEFTADQSEVEKDRCKPQVVLKLANQPELIDCKKISNWRRLVRVSAYILKFISNLRMQLEKNKTAESSKEANDGLLTPQELHDAEIYWVKESQKGLLGRLKKGDFQKLSPFTDNKGIIRVGGRADEALISYEARHPALLSQTHWISLLITRHFHQTGHSGVATTVVKVRKKFWIPRAHDLAKTVKFRCAPCREMEPRVETQFMADLPRSCLEAFTSPFHFTACDCFGPYKVKVSRNKTAKYYGLIFMCLNTKEVHLELAVDYSTMEFMQTLRRFFAIRGLPAMMLSNNVSQLVGEETRTTRDDQRMGCGAAEGV